MSATIDTKYSSVVEEPTIDSPVIESTESRKIVATYVSEVETEKVIDLIVERRTPADKDELHAAIDAAMSVLL